MVSVEEARQMALSLPAAGEQPHFDRTAFTVRKKIFATWSAESRTMNLRLTPQEQFIICPSGSDVVYPVPGTWGKQGWTTIQLSKASKKMVQQALKKAYELRKGK